MKKMKNAITQGNQARRLYAVQPWQAKQAEEHTEIVAYVEASGEWEAVLEVKSTSGASHEMMAAYLLPIIHEHQKRQDVLQDALDALQLIINDGLTFSSEQAAEHAVRNIKKVQQISR